MTTVADLEVIYQEAVKVRQARKDSRTKRPDVKLWDGNWALRGRVTSEISGDFKWLLNQAGTGVLTLPADHYLAKWIMRPAQRSTENVHITVDKDGARWDGRMKSATMKKTASGQLTVVVTFMHSFHELSYFQAWSNPFLPAGLQVPRVFMLAGPSVWALKLSLHLQVLRKEAALWHLPDDPMDLESWFDLDQSNWSVVVAPRKFITDDSMWGLISSRFKTWTDMASDLLEDAQLMVTTRRWLEGDPEPWPNANLHHGALIVDIVDKSGYMTETSTGGTVLGGLARTFTSYFDVGDDKDFIEAEEREHPNPSDDLQYRIAGWLGTRPNQPWVVYREGAITGIQTSEFTIHPATAVQINSGGHSAPGINAAMGATVIMVGNLIGSTFLQSGIGAVADTVLSPIYTDTVGAWMSHKSLARAQRLGWSHYFEYFQEGADRAYTLSSLIAMRAGLWATRSYFTHKLSVRDGAPYLIGENGHGHFFLGDRIGSTVAGMNDGDVYVDQVSGLDLMWSRGVAASWQITIGSDRDLLDGGVRALAHIQKMTAALHDMGVL